MFVPIVQAARPSCGAKAAGLGALLRAGLPVPDGFVVPMAVYRDTVGKLVEAGAPDASARRVAIERCPIPRHLLDALDDALERLGAVAVAVRSSATNEDGVGTSAAGQYDSFLAVQGVEGVAEAVRSCWASLYSSRAVDYRGEAPGSDEPGMAVIVQTHLDADISGVMFTPTEGGGDTTIDAAWGLGPSIVAGTVTPDTYRIEHDGKVVGTVADKRTRLDRVGLRLRVRDVDAASRTRAALDDTTAGELAALGTAAAAALGGPQDIEWAIADHRAWLLQARPITAAAPSRGPTSMPHSDPATLTGTPGSYGTATGTARSVRGAGDFARIHPGDILICPFTDPAWTPLLRVAAGVVTETGGALSHAAIVAREQHIPAVLGVANALTSIPDGATITIDGAAGTVTIHDAHNGPASDARA